MGIIKWETVDRYDQDRADIAIIAALLHDLGNSAISWKKCNHSDIIKDYLFVQILQVFSKFWEIWNSVLDKDSLETTVKNLTAISSSMRFYKHKQTGMN